MLRFGSGNGIREKGTVRVSIIFGGSPHIKDSGK